MIKIRGDSGFFFLRVRKASAEFTDASAYQSNCVRIVAPYAQLFIHSGSAPRIPIRSQAVVAKAEPRPDLLADLLAVLVVYYFTSLLFTDVFILFCIS